MDPRLPTRPDDGGAGLERGQERLREALFGLTRGCGDLIGVATLDARALLFVNDVARMALGIGDRDLGALAVGAVLSDAEQRRFATEIWPAVLASGRWEGELEIADLATRTPRATRGSAFVVASRRTGQPIAVGGIVADVRRDEEEGRAETARLLRRVLEALLSDVADDADELARVLRTLDERSSRLAAAEEERHHAACRLRESESRYRALYDHNPAMYFTLDARGTVLEVNRFGAEQLGYAPSLLVGRTVLDVVHESDHERVLRGIERCAREPGPAVPSEIQKVRRDGSTLFVRELSRGIIGADGEPVVLVVCEDVSERRRLEREVLEVSAREQRRIGHDLHDGLGQQLTGIAFLASALARRLDGAGRPDDATRAGEIGKLLDRAIALARDLARGLCPVDLDDEQGLASALGELCRQTEALFGARCAATGDARLGAGDEGLATQLYFITREAVHNAVKHGRPSRVSVRLSSPAASAEALEGVVHLEVEDDGTGFVPGARAADACTGLGLRIMEYRARLVGGTLEVESAPGRGTVVRCTAPRAVRPAPS